LKDENVSINDYNSNKCNDNTVNEKIPKKDKIKRNNRYNEDYNNKNDEYNVDNSIQGNTINFSDINFYERNNTTANSNGSSSSLETFSLRNINNNDHQKSFYNDTLNDIPESYKKITYKLLDEGIINEEFSLDVHETIENIINNRPYLPLSFENNFDKDLYSLIHDIDLRKKYFNPSEIKMCPLVKINKLND